MKTRKGRMEGTHSLLEAYALLCFYETRITGQLVEKNYAVWHFITK